MSRKERQIQCKARFFLWMRNPIRKRQAFLLMNNERQTVRTVIMSHATERTSAEKQRRRKSDLRKSATARILFLFWKSLTMGSSLNSKTRMARSCRRRSSRSLRNSCAGAILVSPSSSLTPHTLHAKQHCVPTDEKSPWMEKKGGAKELTHLESFLQQKKSRKNSHLSGPPMNERALCPAAVLVVHRLRCLPGEGKR